VVSSEWGVVSFKRKALEVNVSRAFYFEEVNSISINEYTF